MSEWYNNIDRLILCWVSDVHEDNRVRIEKIKGIEQKDKRYRIRFVSTTGRSWKYATPVGLKDLEGNML